jgi:hypothetical protein
MRHMVGGFIRRNKPRYSARATCYITKPTASPPKQEHKAMQATLTIDDKLVEEASKIAATENQSHPT